VVSWTIPYLLSFLLHGIAVFLLYKAATSLFAVADFRRTFFAVGPLTVLLAAITFAARIPWLVKPRIEWKLACAGSLAFGSLVAYALLPDDVGRFVAGPVAFFTDKIWSGAHGGVVALVCASILVAASSWFPLIWRSRNSRKILVGAGVTVVGLMLIQLMVEVREEQPVWPVILASLAFLYLWWLAIAMFDLGFIWHRYIRNSVANDSLSHWRVGQEPPPKVCIQAAGKKAAQGLRNTFSRRGSAK
jgi:hypothetical protein